MPAAPAASTSGRSSSTGRSCGVVAVVARSRRRDRRDDLHRGHDGVRGEGPVRRRGRVGAGQRRGHVLLPQHPERLRARRAVERDVLLARHARDLREHELAAAAEEHPGRRGGHPPGELVRRSERRARARSCAPARLPRSPGPRASWRAGRRRGRRAPAPRRPERRERGERVDADAGERDGADDAAGGRVGGSTGSGEGRGDGVGDAPAVRGRGSPSGGALVVGVGQRSGDDEHRRSRAGERADGARLLSGGHLGRRPEPRPGRRPQGVRARTGGDRHDGHAARRRQRDRTDREHRLGVEPRELGQPAAPGRSRGRSAGPGRRAPRPPTRR